MAVPPAIHRWVRAITSWYPFRIPAYGFNVVLSWLGFDGEQPRWMLAAPRGTTPGLVLNVSNRYHRKLFYFLKAYWREACAEPLGEFLGKTLKPGGIFLDVGAHLGLFSFLAARLVGERGAVHAFEPDPLTVHSLRASSPHNGGHIHIHAVALADEAGELPLFRAAVQAHSLVPSAGQDTRYTGDFAVVPVTTLDAWACQMNVDVSRIQAIKIDVEGFEAKTVAGAVGFLRRAGRPPIWCEVRGPAGSTRAPDTFRAVLSVLAPLGYLPFRWNGGALRSVEVCDVVGREDILFCTSHAIAS